MKKTILFFFMAFFSPVYGHPHVLASPTQERNSIVKNQEKNSEKEEKQASSQVNNEQNHPQNQSTENDPLSNLKPVYFFIDSLIGLLVKLRKSFLAKISNIHSGVWGLWKEKSSICAISFDFFYALLYHHALYFAILFLLWLLFLYLLSPSFLYERIVFLLKEVLSTPYTPTIIVIFLFLISILCFFVYHIGLYLFFLINPLEEYFFHHKELVLTPYSDYHHQILLKQWKNWKSSCVFLFSMLSSQWNHCLIPLYISPYLKNKEWILIIEKSPLYFQRVFIIFYLFSVFIDSTSGTLTVFGIEAVWDLAIFISVCMAWIGLLPIEHQLSALEDFFQQKDEQKSTDSVHKKKTAPVFITNNIRPTNKIRLFLLFILIHFLFFTDNFLFYYDFLIYFFCFLFFGPFFINFVKQFLAEFFNFFSFYYLGSFIKKNIQQNNDDHFIASVYDFTLFFCSIIFSLYMNNMSVSDFIYIQPKITQFFIEKFFDSLSIFFIFFILHYLLNYIYDYLDFYLLEDVSEELFSKRKTILNIIHVLMRIFFVSSFIVVFLTLFGIDVMSFLTSINLLAFGFALGCQHFVRDFLSGIFIMMEGTLSVGDKVIIDNLSGTVEDLSLRRVSFRQTDGTLVSISLGTVTCIKNQSRKYSYVVLNVYFSHTIHLDQARLLLNKAYERLKRQTPINNALIGILEFDGIKELTQAGMIVRARIKTKINTQKYVHMAFNSHLKKIFEEENISYPQHQTQMLSLTSAQLSFVD